MSRRTHLLAGCALLAANAACSDVLGIGDLPSLTVAPDVGGDAPFDASIDGPADVCGEACACPEPVAGELHVSPTGVDTGPGANGSRVCPFKTVTRAIERAVVLAGKTLVILHHEGDVPSSFGDDCTGGPPCDATPIVIPASFVFGLDIAGDGAPDQVTVTGASVFSVHAPGVGFANMTIAPTAAPAADGSLGFGIQYEADVTAPTGGVPGPLIHDLVIAGSLPAGAGSGTGNGLAIRGAPALTVGANVTFGRGRHSIFHGGHGELVLAGTAEAPVQVGPSSADCIVVAGGVDDPPTLSLDHVDLGPCGINAVGAAALVVDTGVAATSRASHVTVTKGGTTDPSYAGVLLRGSAALTIEDGDFVTRAEAFIVLDAASLGARRVSIRSELDGARLATTGSVSLEQVTSVGNGKNGVNCSAAKLSMRQCSTYGNTASGVVVGAACDVDLGTESSAGGNVFGLGSRPNGASGLCFVGARTSTLYGDTFGCGFFGAGCVAGTPTTIISDGACAVADISVGTGGSIVSVAGQCCP